MTIAILDIINNFQIPGTFEEVNTLKLGHINDTYVSKWSSGRYVHQRINQHVFPNVPELMENLQKVLKHVARKIEANPSSSNDVPVVLVNTKSNESYFKDSEGNYWRTYEHVPKAKSILFCENEKLAYQAASACGRFQEYIWDLDPKDFHVIIKDFHNSNFRLKRLEEASKKDSASRLKLVQKEVDAIFGYKDQIGSIMEALNSGQLPWRVTHNDIKFNNVLFDEETKEAKALVDLDLCMPGSVLFDFGDLVRSTSVQSAEDEQDLSKVFLKLSYFEALAKGYVGQIATHLTPIEWELFAVAPKVVTLTLAARFLTDYLEGDHYFKINYPEHNLVRTRNQLAVADSMEKQYSEMCNIIGTLKN
jgi:hypothetical protein